MPDWLEPMGSFPDWGDADKLIELRYADGSILRGRLWLEDVMPASDGDECPLWRVVPEDAPILPDPGSGVSIWYAEKYRFI